jgi:cation diffusion facilitator family transporter
MSAEPEHADGPGLGGGVTTVTSRRSVLRNRQDDGSRRTVLIALAANAIIAVAQLAGGLVSGSSAMLAEAVHSIADTTNQSFLLVSIRLSGREPTPERPFGSGMERFLWTFVAAVGMFVAGAAFAIGYGVYQLLQGGSVEKGLIIAFAVLALAIVAEGTSWLRALRQTRAAAKADDKGLYEFVRGSRDPTTKLVLFEDSAALIGNLLAALGLGLSAITGIHVFDPIASILIGGLLVAVAMWMGRDAKDLLVGSSARPDEREEIERLVEEHEYVEDCYELLTLVLGPNSLLVAARVDLVDDVTGAQAEQLASELDERLSEAIPDITEVFIDPTPRNG